MLANRNDGTGDIETQNRRQLWHEVFGFAFDDVVKVWNQSTGSNLDQNIGGSWSRDIGFADFKWISDTSKACNFHFCHINSLPVVHEASIFPPDL